MTTETLTPMQTELLARADSIFAAIAKAAQSATTFAAEQLPDIALQYVAYGRAYTTVLLIIGIMFAITSIWLAVITWKRGTYADSGAATFVGMVITGLVSFGMIAPHLSNFLMVWFAPKIWLIQNIITLVKQ